MTNSSSLRHAPCSDMPRERRNGRAGRSCRTARSGRQMRYGSDSKGRVSSVETRASASVGSSKGDSK